MRQGAAPRLFSVRRRGCAAGLAQARRHTRSASALQWRAFSVPTSVSLCDPPSKFSLPMWLGTGNASFSRFWQLPRQSSWLESHFRMAILAGVGLCQKGRGQDVAIGRHCCDVNPSPSRPRRRPQPSVSVFCSPRAPHERLPFPRHSVSCSSRGNGSDPWPPISLRSPVSTCLADP